jgi:hypothetical protein
MKTLFILIAAFLLVLADFTYAKDPYVLQVSTPVQYNSTTWYAYASLAYGYTWDQANFAVTSLSNYNGAVAQLATFATADQFNFFVNHLADFSNPSIGDWDIAWVGATNAGGGTYRWADGSGVVTGPWDSGQPSAGDLGVTLKLSGYGNLMASLPGTDSTIGNAIVEYVSSIPEPSTWALIGAGVLGLLVTRRRRVQRSGRAFFR